MKLTIEQFARLQKPARVIIHSLDQALYQVTVVINGRSQLLAENSGRIFRSRSLQGVREMLQDLPVASVTLQQESAYDEMVGQPARQQKNTLEVPLSLDNKPPPIIH